LGDRESEYDALIALATLGLQHDEVQKAEEMYQQLVEIAETRNDAYGKGLGLRGLGDVAFRRRDMQEAEARYHQAIETAEAIANHHDKSFVSYMALFGLGQVAQYRGHMGVAENYLSQAKDLAEQSRSPQDAISILYNLAQVELQRGRVSQAERVFMAI